MRTPVAKEPPDVSLAIRFAEPLARAQQEAAERVAEIEQQECRKCDDAAYEVEVQYAETKRKIRTQGTFTKAELEQLEELNRQADAKRQEIEDQALAIVQEARDTRALAKGAFLFNHLPGAELEDFYRQAFELGPKLLAQLDAIGAEDDHLTTRLEAMRVGGSTEFEIETMTQKVNAARLRYNEMRAQVIRHEQWLKQQGDILRHVQTAFRLLLESRIDEGVPRYCGACPQIFPPHVTDEVCSARCGLELQRLQKLAFDDHHQCDRCNRWFRSANPPTVTVLNVHGRGNMILCSAKCASALAVISQELPSFESVKYLPPHDGHSIPTAGPIGRPRKPGALSSTDRSRLRRARLKKGV